MVYRKKDDGFDWITIKVCHDPKSDMWSIQAACKTCDKVSMGGPISEDRIGQEVQRLFPIYLCERCASILTRYNKIQEPKTETLDQSFNESIVTHIEQEKRPPLQMPLIHCRNHMEFKENCGQCLSANSRRKMQY